MRFPSKTTPVRKRVWNIGRFLVILGALAATFGVFFLAGLRVTTHAREVKVPDLKGKSIAEAQAALASTGLVLRIDEPRRADSSVPADHVLSQEPEAGAVVRRQRAIRVRVSDGHREPIVPVVAELSEKTAEGALSAEQLSIGYRGEVHSANYRADVVVGQDPPAGQRGGAVNLLINRADATSSFVMPDLIGTLAARSAEVLRSRSFRVAITSEVPYPGLPPGIVLRQAPQPGFRIQAGETMTLEVSR
jgi:serine/threonine-protein kinase